MPRKKWFTDRLNMNIAGDLDVKPLVNQTKKLIIYIHLSLSRGIMFLRLLSAYLVHQKKLSDPDIYPFI